MIRVTGSVAAGPGRLQHSDAIKILGQFFCNDHSNHLNMNEFRKCLLSCAYRVGAFVRPAALGFRTKPFHDRW